MKTYYVYELVNQSAEIEYIGCSYRPKERYYAHTCINGKFYGRNDIEVKIIKSFNNRLDALTFEGEHKIKNGFEWSEDVGRKKAGAMGGKISGKLVGKMNGIRGSSKSVNIYDYSTNEFIGNYYSIREAARQLNVYQSPLTAVAKGKYKQHKGYKVEYA